MTICSFTQKYTVEIEVDCAGQENTHREKKQAVLALVQEYLSFRMKREDKRAWQDKSLQIIERMRGICDDDIFSSWHRHRFCWCRTAVMKPAG